MSKTKRIYLAAGIAACVLAAAGGFAWRARAAAADSVTAEIQTAVVQIGDITISATGSAQLIPSRSSALSFSTQDTVEEILVEVGDSVKQGDVVARLDSEAATVALATAETNLRQLTSPEAIANSQISLVDAQDALKTAKYNLYVQQQGHRTTTEVIKLTEARLAQAQDALKEAKHKYNLVSGRDKDDHDRANALEQLVAAQKQVNTYKLSLNWYTGKPNAVDQARLEAEMALAEAQVASSQALVDELTGQATPDESVDIASDDLIALRQARLNVEAAQATLDATNLTAPFDGVITEVNGYVGESSDGFSIGLADLKHPIIDLAVDESDLDKVAVSDPVELSLDALPDTLLLGSLLRVDPLLVALEGVQTVHAVGELDADSLATVLSLPMGMSGTIEVIHARTQGALLVPIGALHELAKGKYGVFVMENGEPRLREVEVGLQSPVYAEILSGLSAGDTVSLGTASE